MGKQGAGKGTQGFELSKYYAIPHISTGEMFRDLVRLDSTMGKELSQYMKTGDLIPDPAVIKAVEERLSFPDCAHGFILDGFPRTIAQAEALSNLGAVNIDLVINLEVPTELVLPRLTQRRVCLDCGANYSLQSPPKDLWVCDLCKGQVTQRIDDTEQVIKKRLNLYESQTSPLLEWYRGKGLLANVDAAGNLHEVTKQLIELIDQKLQDRTYKSQNFYKGENS